MSIFRGNDAWLIRKGCTGKHRFAVRKTARRALRYCKRMKRPQRSVYYCEFCKGYHLTSQERQHAEDSE